MTREHWKELLPIITAFAKGEQVQFRDGAELPWMDVETGDSIGFGNGPSNYRIAPKSEDAEWLRGMIHTLATHENRNHLIAIADKLERLEAVQ